ncbi:four helix bundle protein [Paraflavitalea soli]|uniref:Four helix bundle protein n=1 Tax=Paraflavitalea soli TaxID=2315862 RepID=A0A3B7MWN0_9BACT|nr:four helix bundle protein [Paraflavitalea soli]AXY77416.1 four helix bundle protein [Paraflavitalea soli]
MFLQLAHKEMDVYKLARTFVISCYQLSKTFPPEEKFNMTQQVRRAALSVQLNIAESAARRSAAERRRFYEIARSSLVEIDTAMDIAVSLSYFTKDEIEELGNIMIRCFQMLTKMVACQ